GLGQRRPSGSRCTLSVVPLSQLRLTGTLRRDLAQRQKVFQEVRKEKAMIQLDIKHWILSHLIWVVGVAVALYGFHTWSAEHDARLKAEATIKQDESQVAVLQQAITQNNQSIAALQAQMAQRDAQNATIIANLVKQKAAVQTPQAAATAITQTVSNLPVPLVVEPDSSLLVPSLDVVPLYDTLEDGKIAAANLSTCTDDLADTKAE